MPDVSSLCAVVLEQIFRLKRKHPHLELASEEPSQLMLPLLAFIRIAVIMLECRALHAERGMPDTREETVTWPNHNQRRLDEAGVGTVNAIVKLAFGRRKRGKETKSENGSQKLLFARNPLKNRLYDAKHDSESALRDDK